jgi:hypothetical protein
MVLLYVGQHRAVSTMQSAAVVLPSEAVAVVLVLMQQTRIQRMCHRKPATGYVGLSVCQHVTMPQRVTHIIRLKFIPAPLPSCAADGFKMDGRRWKVDWASRADFDLFGWRWTEGRSPSPRR